MPRLKSRKKDRTSRHNHSEDKGQGVVLHESGLHQAQVLGPGADQVADAIDRAIDDSGVDKAPQADSESPRSGRAIAAS